ncbi:MAG TPA: hypothetical protein VJ904_05800, partial [Tichowtungia sp.]|nr:hypothetical protein [Tichowtungia sp.]
PWLPMSPGDIKLIFDGLFKRGTLVQFDRCDTEKMKDFFEEHRWLFNDKPMRLAIEEFFEQDHAYRRSLPDIPHHGFRVLFDDELQCDIRAGLIEGYLADDVIDEDFAQKLQEGGMRFSMFHLLGMVPILGKMIRKRWGNTAYRKHAFAILTNSAYRRTALSAYAANTLIAWHRAGRADEKHAEFMQNRPGLFLAEKCSLGLLPVTLHRVILRPSRIGQRIKAGWNFLKKFITSATFRERWFLNEIALGEKDGMLTPEEREMLEGVVRDPFIVKYLKCLGVHFATVPVTQIVSVLIGAIWAGWLLAHQHPWEHAAGAFAGTVALFQVTPVSPGSICRGGFVVYLMIKERNLRDYLIAAPVSFLKYVGYLAFPLQMTSTYPHLARFMASRWATNMVHVIPVFGERGALFEHWVFDTFFNRPQKFAKWAAPRMNWLLDGWMIFGLLLAILAFTAWPQVFIGSLKAEVNLALGVIVLFILPRLLFYPLMKRNAHQPAEHASL